MKFKASIDRQSSVKNGMKITIHIADEEAKNVMKNLYQFLDKPLYIDMQIDAEKQLKRMDMISHEQRKKIFALIGDIANHSGYEPEELRPVIEKRFCENIAGIDTEIFSLSDISKDIASKFIEYLLKTAFSLGVELTEQPKDAFDLETWTRICLEYKKCVVCGKPSEVHHWDSVGANGGRKVDDSDLRKIALCRIHHSECHQIGRDTFAKKYHVKPIIWNE